MTLAATNAWGHPSRYYAAVEAFHAKPPPPDKAAMRLAESLEKSSPGIREAVERTVKQWNNILRDVLRSETALRLSVGSESQAVPVRVVAAVPQPFAEVMRELAGLEHLLLNRPAIMAAASGTAFMAGVADKAREVWGAAAGPSGRDEITRVQQTAQAWLKELDRVQAIEKITGINEDVLGAYFFRIPEIRIYWVVIGITACALGISAEALTVVVLAHELAHAYTHLGRDIDSVRWDTERFALAELDIVEGLAQFYTAVLCRRLDARMPAAIAAYKRLLEKQSGPYKAHLAWVKNDEEGGEIMRVAMIECRSQGMTEAAKFAEAVARYRKAIPKRSRPQPLLTEGIVAGQMALGEPN